MKTLHFPTTPTALTVWSRPPTDNLGKGWHELTGIGFTEVAPARGQVTIPADHQVALQLQQNTSDLSSTLAQLNPDDIHTFAIKFELQPVEIHDADVQALSRFKSLQSLSLQRTPITDAALADIATLENLRSLNLTWVNGITDAGFEHLRALKKIEKFFGFSRHLGDKSFAVIMSWKNTIREARFGEMHVTDQAFMEISNCKKLIGIHCPQIGPNAITALANLPIDRLIIYNNQQMNDEAMKRLVPQFMRMPHLKSLDLGGSAITDEGAQELAKCTNLTWLAVHRTKITPAGLEQLKTALPNCKIE